MRVLLTGMSGSGKSALVQELRRRGYAAYDADDDGFSEPRADGRWGWRADAVASLLAQIPDGDLLFFAGCSEEQIEMPFDYRVVLTVPEDELCDAAEDANLERVRTEAGGAKAGARGSRTHRTASPALLRPCPEHYRTRGRGRGSAARTRCGSRCEQHVTSASGRRCWVMGWARPWSTTRPTVGHGHVSADVSGPVTAGPRTPLLVRRARVARDKETLASILKSGVR